MTTTTDSCRYIVFDGPDGSGKSTLSRFVLDALRRTRCADRTALHVAFPTTTTAPGKLVRRVFDGYDTVSERGMAFLMLADLVEFEPQLAAQYASGGYIVADRHAFTSGWAYQTEVYGLDYVLAYQGRDHFLHPDRIFVLDVPAAVAEERIARRAEERNKIYERKDPLYQERLRERYLSYAIMNSRHTRVLDGTRTVEELVATVLTSLDSPLSYRPLYIQADVGGGA